MRCIETQPVTKSLTCEEFSWVTLNDSCTNQVEDLLYGFSNLPANGDETHHSHLTLD